MLRTALLAIALLCGGITTATANATECPASNVRGATMQNLLNNGNLEQLQAILLACRDSLLEQDQPFDRGSMQENMHSSFSQAQVDELLGMMEDVHELTRVSIRYEAANYLHMLVDLSLMRNRATEASRYMEQSIALLRANTEVLARIRAR
jgi:hypothetical protein